jgi:hypothetical protein
MKLCASLSQACFGGFDSFWNMPIDQLAAFVDCLKERENA